MAPFDLEDNHMLAVGKDIVDIARVVAEKLGHKIAL